MNYRNYILCLLTSVIISCSSHGRLDEPLVFQSPSEFYNILEELRETVTIDDFNRLTDAVGYLKISDKQHFTIEAFYQSLSGLSANQIIDKSIQLKIHNKSQADEDKKG